MLGVREKMKKHNQCRNGPLIYIACTLYSCTFLYFQLCFSSLAPFPPSFLPI